MTDRTAKVAILMATLFLMAQAPDVPCPSCMAFPPYDPIDCSPAAKQAGGGACLDMHPAQTYCHLKVWIASHQPSAKDYDFAVQSEQIWRPVYGALECVGTPVS